jgi:hypothetical protein
MEYILCAAIWYKELPLARNDVPIGHYLPINCACGIVFAGRNHMQCLYQMVVLTGKRQAEVGEYVSGFLTNENRFVNRIEGMRIAREAKQVGENTHNSSKLFSEDLY